MPLQVHSGARKDERLLGNPTLWRYMDLPRLIGLLSSSTLYFSRLDLLRNNDSHEGVVSRDTALIAAERFAASDENVQHAANPATAARFMNFLTGRSVYLSSWHLARGESMAMWRIYSTEYGLAVKSTLKRVTNAIIDERKVDAFRVHYTDDLDRNPPTLLHGRLPWAQAKRTAYGWEQELRLAIEDPRPPRDIMLSLVDDSSPSGIPVAVSPRSLILEVVVSPYADALFMSAVEQVVRALCPSIGVRRSNLLDEPTYG